VIPGNLAHALRGASTETARRDYARMSAEMNLHGEAAPRRTFMSPSRRGSHESNELKLTRTDTNLSHTHTPVLIMKDVGKGLGRTLKPIVRLPSNMFYAMTLGLRNAPRLYGDKTVRPPHDPIHGFRDGLEVAGQEFWFGIYDGVTGLVRIPYLEVSEDGAMGLPKGIARGIGGLALKPTAGAMGLSAYTVKGIQMSLRKKYRDIRRTERWIRRARMSQGAKAVQELKTQGLASGQRGPPDARHSGSELERMRTKVLTQWSTRGLLATGENAGTNGHAVGTSQQKPPRSPKKAETF